MCILIIQIVKPTKSYLQNIIAGIVFDAAMQRWNALQFTYGDHFKPTLGNFSKFFCLCVLPIGLTYRLAFGPSHMEYRNMVARGEVPYNAPSRKNQWFAN